MNNLRGAKIIYQESKATQPSHLYFLQKDANYCEIIVTSESGVKRRLNSSVDLSNYYTKTELDTALATKQNKLSSFDESILIETDGNIAGNISLFEEYFQQQVCELNFVPTQIIGVYQDGIKLLPEEVNITLPKTITIKTYSTEKIEIQYTHLKS